MACSLETKRRQLCTALTILCLTGCSIHRMALKSMGDALSRASDEYARDEDPELVKAAIPFSLKVMETILRDNPRDQTLLLNLTKGFTQYAFGFLLPDAEALDDKDKVAAKAIRDRAVRMFIRARGYGLRALEVKHPNFGSLLAADPKKAAASLTRADVPAAFWTGAAWGSAIATSRDFRMLPELPRMESLLERVLTLDDSYDAGAVHTLFITYEMVRLKPNGDRVALATKHFERALALTQGKQAGPYVTYAESVLTVEKNRAEFERMLHTALAIDPAKDPDDRLENVIMQRRARWLLGRVDQLFPKK
ncbi:MAG TPA: TRAP transporter TatT component family protein [Bryobacteraceae bacterium]